MSRVVALKGHMSFKLVLPEKVYSNESCIVYIPPPFFQIKCIYVLTKVLHLLKGTMHSESKCSAFHCISIHS